MAVMVSWPGCSGWTTVPRGPFLCVTDLFKHLALPTFHTTCFMVRASFTFVHGVRVLKVLRVVLFCPFISKAGYGGSHFVLAAEGRGYCLDSVLSEVHYFLEILRLSLSTRLSTRLGTCLSKR